MSPLVAMAHAHLGQAVPADGSVLGAAPDSIMLMFSESAHLTALSIQRQGDARAQKIGALPTTASEHFAIPAPRLGPGVYTITYRVVAVDDGHTSSGAIKFTVAPGAVASAQVDAGPRGYNAVGTVKQVDVAAGKVTIAHDAIAALAWPAMTMSFTIKDKTLFDKLAVDKRVQFNVEKQGALYVVTDVK